MKTTLFILSLFSGALATIACAMTDDPIPGSSANKLGDSESARNKQLILDMYREVFDEKNVDALDKYIDEAPKTYIQHNAFLPDGRAALKEQAKKWFAAGHWDAEVQRIAAEGDLVFLHSKVKAAFLKEILGPDTTTIAHVDIFKMKNGKIIEHWDVIQPVPKTAANDHPMF